MDRNNRIRQINWVAVIEVLSFLFAIVNYIHGWLRPAPNDANNQNQNQNTRPQLAAQPQTPGPGPTVDKRFRGMRGNFYNFNNTFQAGSQFGAILPNPGQEPTVMEVQDDEEEDHDEVEEEHDDDDDDDDDE